MQEILEPLEKAIILGGTSLTKKAIGLSAKKAQLLFNELCQKQLLKESAKNKYDVTSKGLEFWKKEVGHSRYEKIKEQVWEDFFQILKKKEGKKLNATESRNILPIWRKEAEETKLIKKKTTNTFLLEPKGEKFLFERLPIDKQAVIKQEKLEEEFDSIEKQQKTFFTQLNSLKKMATDNLPQSAEITKLNTEVASHLEKQVQKFKETFVDTMKEIRSTALFSMISETLQKEVQEANLKAIEQAEEYYQRTAEKIEETKQEFTQSCQALEENLSNCKETSLSKQNEILADIQSLQKKLKTENVQEQRNANHFDENSLFELLKKSYQSYCKKNPAYAGSMPIPNLFDELIKESKNLSLKDFHKMLIKWKKEQKLSLRVCNSPRLEPRSKEGIKSEYGILFYVRVKGFVGEEYGSARY